MTADGASLTLGAAAATISHNPLNTSDSPATLALSGDYNFATGALSVMLEQLDVDLGFAQLHTGGVLLSYTPQAGGLGATMMLGATGVSVSAGLTTGSNLVGLQVSNGSLALVVVSNTPVSGPASYTYGLDTTGTVALVGLPANTLALSGNVEVQVNTLGAINQAIAVDNNPAHNLTLNFTGNVSAAVAGSNLTLSVGGVVSVTGQFSFTKTTETINNAPVTTLLVGASVSTFLGTSDQSMGLAIHNATFGLAVYLDPTSSTYALDASAPVQLVGFSSVLGLTGTAELKVNTTGRTVSESISIPNQANPFSLSLAANQPLSFAATGATLTVGTFATLTGDFGFTKLAPVVNGTVTTSQVQIAASITSAFVGDNSNPSAPRGLSLSTVELGLILVQKVDSSLTTQAPLTYALTASGGASLSNLPGLTLASPVNLTVRVNTTGAAVNQTLQAPDGQSVTVTFADGSNVTDVEGAITGLGVGLPSNSTPFLTVSGSFSFNKQTSGTVTTLAVAATGVTATATASGLGVTLSNGTLALEIYSDSNASAATYALNISGGVSLTGFGELTVGGTLSAEVNTNGSAVNDQLNVNGTVVPLQVGQVVDTAQWTSSSTSVALSQNPSDTNVFNASTERLGLQVAVTHSGSTTTLDGSKYTISGNTTSGYTLAFTTGNAPVAGDTVQVTYWVAGNSERFAATGLTLKVGSFATLTGNFTIQQQNSSFAISATGVTATVGVSDGTSFTGLSISNASASLAVSSSGYTLSTTGDSVSLLGIPNLTLSGSGWSVNVDTTKNTPVYDVAATSATLSVSGFANLTGGFGLQKTSSGDLLVGLTSVNVTLGTSDTNLTVNGANLGLIVHRPAGSATAQFALVATAATASLNTTISDLGTATISSVLVEVSTGFDAGSIAAAVTQAPWDSSLTTKFSSLGTQAIQTIQAHISSFTIANFVSLSGDFSFTQQVVTSSSTTSLTKLLIGADNVTAFVGQGTIANPTFGLELTSGELGLVLFRDTIKGTNTYALTASGTLTPVGLPTGLSLSATTSLQINKTGGAVNERIGTPDAVVTVYYTDGSNGTVDQRNFVSFGGSLQIGVSGIITLSGNFVYTIITPANQTDPTKMEIGVTGLTGSANDGANLASLSNGTLGLVIYQPQGANPANTYALSASGTASVLGGSASATVTVLMNSSTAASPISESIAVGNSVVQITLDATQHASSTSSPFKLVQVSNITTPIPGLNAILQTLTISAGSNTSISVNHTFDDASLGGFLGLTSLNLSGNLTLSAGNWSGQLTATATGATLFPGRSFSATLGSITGHVTFASDGTYSFSLSVSGFALTIGEALRISDTGTVTVSYNSSGAAQQNVVDFTNTTVTVSSPQFGITGTIANLVVSNNGFAFDSASLTAATASLGSILSASNLSLSLSSGLVVTYASTTGGSSTITDKNGVATTSLTLGIGSLSLFPGSFVQTTATGITATYSFGSFDGLSATGRLSITIGSLDLSIGDAANLHATGVTVTPGNAVIAQIGSAALTFPDFSSVPAVQLSNFQLLQTGFTIGSLTVQSPGATLGNVLSFGGVTLTLSHFNYSTSTSQTDVSPTLTTGANTFTLQVPAGPEFASGGDVGNGHRRWGYDDGPDARPIHAERQDPDLQLYGHPIRHVEGHLRDFRGGQQRDLGSKAEHRRPVHRGCNQCEAFPGFRVPEFEPERGAGQLHLRQRFGKSRSEPYDPEPGYCPG